MCVRARACVCVYACVRVFTRAPPINDKNNVSFTSHSPFTLKLLSPVYYNSPYPHQRPYPLPIVCLCCRRRGYNVPHTRLTEEKGRRGSARGSTVSTSSSSTVHSSKVTYARHNSNDSVQLDEGFENPTYGVTMAMLTDQ